MSELEIYKGMVKKMKDDEIKKEILMMYELADDNDLKYYEAIQRIIDYITNLQQENERLKEKSINEVLKNDFDMCVKDLKKANKKIEKLEDYKSRCEKAVEYINSGIGKSLKEEYCCFEILLNILNGRSDE